jgi:Ca2+-binding RTX toxin-like protein
VPGVDDGGNDRVYSTVSYTLSPFLERLVLLESPAAISATGNAQVNSIVGNSNANFINGGGGKDTLTGGLGADTFVLGPANAANTVTITDFAAEDRFGITAIDYGLSQGNGLVDNGSGALVLDPTWFATVTGTQGTVAGHGQFLYNTTTGLVRLFSASQRGLSGRNKRALIKIAASRPPVPNSNRQSVSMGCARSIAMAVIAARTMPTDCNAIVATVMRLRKARGMISDT